MTDNQPTLRVVFSGKQGVGKDVCADALIKRLGVDAQRVAFSKPLREELGELLDIFRALRGENFPEDRFIVIAEREMSIEPADSKVLYGLLAKLSNIDEVTPFTRTPETRALLQYLGTDVRRSRDQEYWVNKWKAEVKDLLDKGTNVFTTDCRFPNEVTAAQEAGLTVIRLTADVETQKARIRKRDSIDVSDEALSHASETGLDDFNGFDMMIDGSALTIEETVDVIIAKLKELGRL